MIIDITLNDFKEITSNSDFIGKVSENKATILKFHLTEKLSKYNFYLDFEKPNGSKFTTQKLNIVDNTVEYEITNSLLDENGYLLLEVVLTSDNEKIIYPSLNFKIETSINATNELAPENKTLISEIEDVLNKIDTSGNGDKFLSDDGTYKNVSSSGGTTDYDKLTNQPIKRLVSMDQTKPIVLRNLDSGIYCLHGYISPFDGSTDLFVAQTPISVNIAKSSSISFIQLFFSFGNQLQYFEVTDSNYTLNTISFNNLATKEYIDNVVGSINTELATLTTVSEVSE